MFRSSPDCHKSSDFCEALVIVMSPSLRTNLLVDLETGLGAPADDVGVDQRHEDTGIGHVC